MPLWVRGFVLRDSAQLQLEWLRTLESAERLVRVTRGTELAGPAREQLAQLRAIYYDFNNDLRTLSQRAAAQAVEGMRQRFDQTQVRTATGSSPHLRTLLSAKPLTVGRAELGWVGVGLVAELDRAINRNSPGYGTYWRAQEFGTGGNDARTGIAVPSQVGRVLYGFFTGPRGGNATPPLAQYAGGGGPHPVFMAMRPAYGSASERPDGPYGTRVGPSGWGTIGREIAPRHFITYGADAAAVQWREDIARAQARMTDRLAEVL